MYTARLQDIFTAGSSLNPMQVQIACASSSHTCSRAATQLLPLLRSESIQNLVIFGLTVLSTCRVSPANACTATAQLTPGHLLLCLRTPKSLLTLQSQVSVRFRDQRDQLSR